MAYLKNTWTMIGWASELVAGGFVHRTVCDEPILVYRLGSGQPAALQDRCPHRFVPLHRGKQVGDLVQCGYHGLCFGADGACAKHPIEGSPIPKAARVRSYPVTERFGILWVWLGAAERADVSLVPDFGFLDDPARANVRGYTAVKANYQLAVDNLSDLTHTQFVHSEYQSSEVFNDVRVEVRQDGNTVYTTLTLPNGRPPVFFANAVPDAQEKVDLVMEARWDAPSVIRLMFRAFRPGDRSQPLFQTVSGHIVTAESAGVSHYFYVNSRDYAVGDAAADEKVREWQRIGFGEQDKPMLEAQQLCIGDQDVMAMKPVLLATDAGAVRVRRVLQALIDAEAAAV